MFTKVEHIHQLLPKLAPAGYSITQLHGSAVDTSYLLQNYRNLFNLDEWSGELQLRQQFPHDAFSMYILEVVVEECDQQCAQRLINVVLNVDTSADNVVLPQTSQVLQATVSSCCANAALAILSKAAANTKSVQVDNSGVARLRDDVTHPTTIYLLSKGSNEPERSLAVKIVPCRQPSSRPHRVLRSATQINDGKSGISIAPYVQVSIPENTPAGTFLVQVPASIPSITTPDALLFQITAGNTAKLFAIDESSGKISTAKTLYAASSSGEHQLTVTASVRNSPTRYSYATSTVHIKLVYINKHAPVFSLPLGQPLYSTSVAENLQPSQPVVQVSATDRDTGRSGQVSFAIVRGNKYTTFSISKNGKIILEKPLDYELMSRYELTVMAYDGGQPVRTVQADVQVSVGSQMKCEVSRLEKPECQPFAETELQNSLFGLYWQEEEGESSHHSEKKRETQLIMNWASLTAQSLWTIVEAADQQCSCILINCQRKCVGSNMSFLLSSSSFR